MKMCTVCCLVLSYFLCSCGGVKEMVDVGTTDDTLQTCMEQATGVQVVLAKGAEVEIIELKGQELREVLDILKQGEYLRHSERESDRYFGFYLTDAQQTRFCLLDWERIGSADSAEDSEFAPDDKSPQFLLPEALLEQLQNQPSVKSLHEKWVKSSGLSLEDSSQREDC